MQGQHIPAMVQPRILGLGFLSGCPVFLDLDRNGAHAFAAEIMASSNADGTFDLLPPFATVRDTLPAPVATGSHLLGAECRDTFVANATFYTRLRAPPGVPQQQSPLVLQALFARCPLAVTNVPRGVNARATASVMASVRAHVCGRMRHPYVLASCSACAWWGSQLVHHTVVPA